MLSKKQFIEEEKDCAAMLGLTLKEYRQNLKNTKAHNTESNEKTIYNNSILYKLGLSEKDLKELMYHSSYRRGSRGAIKQVR